ncbi:MAG: type I methionyl aminopeptidase [Cyanobacteria bacterium QS_4_48_99]|nr:MAG: type I methionyl aminopeptidase [Cyanobacteria bacterium QS_4_48_99]
MNFLTNLLSPHTKSPRTKRKPRGIQVKSPQEVEIMRRSGKIVATVLKEVSEMVEPGMSTAEIDAYAEKRIREMEATPSFKGYYGFSGSICSCINNEVVHGIPSPKKVVHAGDILKVDVGAYQGGFHGDSCITIAIGEVNSEARQLMRVAEETLYKGIEQVKAGNSLLDIAGAIEDQAKASGYSVIEDFTGHGVGNKLHEEPAVFNVRTRKLPNVKLRAGMTLAIEPILNVGSRIPRTLPDRWTVVTVDNSLSAQFEHTVLVTADGYEILTDRSQV